eukprot:5811183-Prymnesium_polylepis.1
MAAAGTARQAVTAAQVSAAAVILCSSRCRRRGRACTARRAAASCLELALPAELLLRGAGCRAARRPTATSSARCCSRTSDALQGAQATRARCGRDSARRSVGRRAHKRRRREQPTARRRS